MDLLTFDYTMLLRLVTAVILGGIIGFERGGNNHDAGLRTHIVLCLGAATVMVISECLVIQYHINGEIMRMGAQVVSGVGFLGAGSIILDSGRVKGITTAAGLWTTACVGIAVGSGYYIIAAATVALMMFAMLGLRSLTRRLRKKTKAVGIRLDLESASRIKEVIKFLIDGHIHFNSVRFEEYEENIGMIIEVRVSEDYNLENLIYELSCMGGVRELSEV